MPEFIKGLQLRERYYREVVRPILTKRFPVLRYAAAHIGPGSDVLGYDTEISTDHHWGPKLLLFLEEADYAGNKDLISVALSEELPYAFLGYSTNFGAPDNIGVRLLRETTSGPVDHMVEIHTVRSFFKEYLDFDVDSEIEPADRLTFSEHRLLGSTSGKVFHDEPRELAGVRERLAYYPRDVWLYMLAAQWTRISQEEAFMGRCGDVGDELGSRLIAAKLVSYLMRLCFLMERKYAPYPKWFGTGFSRLGCAAVLTPVFQQVLSAPDWRQREQNLSEAYETIAEMHNRLGITKPLETNVRAYYGRPYKVISAERFADEIEAVIKAPEVKALTQKIGSVSQFAESTDVFDNVQLRGRLKALYHAPGSGE